MSGIPPNSPGDTELLAAYRTRFRKGPIGVWHTWLGAGWDSSYGCRFAFRKDRSGLAYSWDTDDNEEPEPETEFAWRPVSDFVIDIQPVGPTEFEEDWGIVQYDFAFGHAKHGGNRKLFLYQVRQSEKELRGFWWSRNPLVLATDNPQHIHLLEGE